MVRTQLIFGAGKKSILAVCAAVLVIFSSCTVSAINLGSYAAVSSTVVLGNETGSLNDTLWLDSVSHVIEEVDNGTGFELELMYSIALNFSLASVLSLELCIYYQTLLWLPPPTLFDKLQFWAWNETKGNRQLLTVGAGNGFQWLNISVFTNTTAIENFTVEDDALYLFVGSSLSDFIDENSTIYLFINDTVDEGDASAQAIEIDYIQVRVSFDGFVISTGTPYALMFTASAIGALVHLRRRSRRDR